METNGGNESASLVYDRGAAAGQLADQRAARTGPARGWAQRAGVRLAEELVLVPDWVASHLEDITERAQ